MISRDEGLFSLWVEKMGEIDRDIDRDREIETETDRDRDR